MPDTLNSSDTMNSSEPLNIVVGYQDAVDLKDRLEEKGSDFLDQKGDVSATIAQLHPKRLQLIVRDIVEETATTKTFRLVDRAGRSLPPFQAGQYINLFVTIDGVETARPYAISSSPEQRYYYDLTVKRVSEGFVSGFLLDKVAVGQSFSSTGPMGTFHHNPVFHGEDLVFLAGGSGSAPARAMILHILQQSMPHSFHMIYSNSYVDDVIYKDELRELAVHHDQFTLTEVISRPPEDYCGHRGRLQAPLIRELLGTDLNRKMYYICGPTPFNEHCLAVLTELGVPKRRIRIECNGPPKSPDLLPDWPGAVAMQDEVTITVQGRGQFKAKAGEPLLNSLERNGYSAENACRSGECSLCRVKLVKGDVFNPP
ncbi:MAG: FAD-binding oxidoreductase [Pseudomonadales bacterium]|nr:FAD-binding oxidoreductase [Pseudomonadales bacterium]